LFGQVNLWLSGNGIKGTTASGEEHHPGDDCAPEKPIAVVV
jgi:hypothetical protein